MKVAACGSLATIPVTGTWYRAIQLRFWHSLLATAHTATIPGRFNAGNASHPGFEILDFAENHHGATDSGFTFLRLRRTSIRGVP